MARLDDVRGEWKRTGDAVTTLRTKLAVAGDSADVRRGMAEARKAERAARKTLHAALQESLPDDPAAEVERMLATLPIVMFPVRIETRFELRPPVPRPPVWVPNLMVRVYPDEIAATSHDAVLTSEEAAAGREYWQSFDSFSFDREPELLAWRTLLLRYPAMRAAWIVRATESRVGPELRPPGWTRPVVSHVMPDRFIYLAYRGNMRVATAVGNAIPDPLPLTLDPFGDPQNGDELTDVSGHGLHIDTDVRWTIDFDAAFEAGMATRILLDPAGVANGFDQLFVLGVKSSLEPEASAERVEALFAGHHFSEGFGFVRQGMPTNNTSDERSGLPLPDPGNRATFDRERGGLGALFPDVNAAHFARALGISQVVAAQVENAGFTEQRNARAMNDALWPATLGYFARQMMDPVFTAAEIETAREHFVGFVHGRGTIPAIRVDAKPYGVLPATSLTRWQPSSRPTPFDRDVAPVLRKLRDFWSSSASAVPRIGPATQGSVERGAELVKTLALDSRMRRFRLRPMIGPTAVFNMLALLGVNPQTWLGTRTNIARNALRIIGRPRWDPLIAWMSFDAAADLYPHPLVSTVVAEDQRLDPNYIQLLRQGVYDTLRTSAPKPTESLLLRHLLWHAALREYDRVASALLGVDRRPDPELNGFAGPAPLDTIWKRLDTVLPRVTGTARLGQYLTDPARDADGTGAHAFRASLAVLETLSTAELERLLTETLDLCSHRLDAWITSLPAKRLEQMRAVSEFGSYLGAYGWVENVRPAPAPVTQTLGDGRVAIVQPDSRGHLHTPSLTQAATSAVLRNSPRPPNLTSARVQNALRVLDAIRAGESLGSVLGAQLERGFRTSQPANSRKAIEWLRDVCPLVANKRVASPHAPRLIAARNVADGLRAHQVFNVAGQSLDGGAFPTAAARTAFQNELRQLDDTLDAITDLLGAESVQQLMTGNTGAAVAALDAMTQGGRPPEIEYVRETRGGTTITHRVGIVLGQERGGISAGWRAPQSPRSSAEPYLNAWYAQLLGDPERIRCTVNGAPFSLSRLALQPIDFVSMETRELELRIAAVLNATSIEVKHAPWPDRSIRSFADALELAAALRDLVRGARPLRPEDLASTARREAAKSAVLANGTRASDALEALEKATFALEGTGFTQATIHAALRQAASFGIRGAYVAHDTALTPALVEHAKTVHEQMLRRWLEAQSKSDAEDVVRAVFGRDFVFLPAFRPAADVSTELDRAIANGATIAPDALTKTQWLQKAAPVRPSLQRWNRVTLLANATGAPRPSLGVVQLPFIAGAKWIALPFANESERPAPGTVSILLDRRSSPAADGTWAGLLVDEWSEVIPAASETTAVSLQYQNRRAEAPQCVLVAVPPIDPVSAAPPPRWNFEWLVDTVRETLLLAKVRGVDLEPLGSFGQVIPALVLPSNDNDDTLSSGVRNLPPTLPES